ncbi:hypothetical protein RYZ59_13075 [Citrobacter sp. HN-141]|nr:MULTISPECIES: hypothetical protein [unclassified Citrobacter]MDW2644505.1 hypothetical protein [Citrobacter sp. HN-141]MDW2653852.1 hypothetical protein [Citrobacter sp. HN-120]MDW2696877.1 hypothetical protein [Citrobacter sp. HN-144]MEB2418824.1 hypothetical protein [Citrobacter sp. R-1.5.2]
MTCLFAPLPLQRPHFDTVPTDPVPIPDPIPRPQPMPDPSPDEEPIKLSHHGRRSARIRAC